MKKEGETASENGELAPKPSNIGLSILDLILCILAAIGVLASALVMGRNSQTLPFSTNSTQFRAVYHDIPAFTFFVVANSVVCVYIVVISIPLSILNIIRSAAKNTRIVLVILDTIMMCLLTSGAASTAAIAYIADNGNLQANWVGFCQQYSSFCSQVSGDLIGSFGAVLVLMNQIITLSVHLSLLAELVMCLCFFAQRRMKALFEPANASKEETETGTRLQICNQRIEKLHDEEKKEQTEIKLRLKKDPIRVHLLLRRSF